MVASMKKMTEKNSLILRLLWLIQRMDEPALRRMRTLAEYLEPSEAEAELARRLANRTQQGGEHRRTPCLSPPPALKPRSWPSPLKPRSES